MSFETGSCMCGACQVTAKPTGEAEVCHCSLCRKWSGGAFIGVICDGPVFFNDGAPLAIYRSTPWGERVSCRNCGSSLVVRMQDGSSHVASVQVFDDPGRFPILTEIFIDRKPASYSFSFSGLHKTMTGAEYLAQSAPQKES